MVADVIDVDPETPNLEAMLAKFSREHWHNEDEVRFIFEGRGFHPSWQRSTYGNRSRSRRERRDSRHWPISAPLGLDATPHRYRSRSATTRRFASGPHTQARVSRNLRAGCRDRCGGKDIAVRTSGKSSEPENLYRRIRSLAQVCPLAETSHREVAS